MLSIGVCAQLACIWEVAARKPGNVSRTHDFADTTLVDFLASAAVIAPVLELAIGRSVGETVLAGVRATRRVVQSNTNLGILLLLAPLAAVPRAESLRAGTKRILEQLDIEDARTVYEAIRLAAPGGLGKTAQQDVRSEPTIGLRDIMRLAADRDLIARQYVNNFADVLDIGAPVIQGRLGSGDSLEWAIIYGHLRFMATYPDSLVARKCGGRIANEIQTRAKRILDAEWPPSTDSQHTNAINQLDDWLRADGNKRNPGTSADLVTASLFVLLREGTIELPSPYSWSSALGHE
jgi:triphosphoribosyl-dephospho-CoA synthase